MKDSEFYSALKKLVMLPEWKVYEAFIQEKIEGRMDLFMTDDGADLKKLQIQSMTLKWMVTAVQKFLSETEDSFKRGKQ